MREWKALRLLFCLLAKSLMSIVVHTDAFQALFQNPFSVQHGACSLCCKEKATALAAHSAQTSKQDKTTKHATNHEIFEVTLIKLFSLEISAVIDLNH